MRPFSTNRARAVNVESSFVTASNNRLAVIDFVSWSNLRSGTELLKGCPQLALVLPQ